MADSQPADLAALRRLNDGGYGFYRNTARVRQDDLFVRGQAAEGLQRALAALHAAEQAARGALPAPSRENPFADPAQLAAIRALRVTQDRLRALETRLRGAASLPDSDFSAIVPTEAVRQHLVTLDAALLTRAEAVERSMGRDAEVAAFEKIVAKREEVGRKK